MSIALQFIGAARYVTGSKHLLHVGERRILLDCGMVQGPRQMANMANLHLGVEAGEIDAVVLSHAHIDHSGSLPRLVKLGFGGSIFCTPATADLLAIMLRDSAHIQAQDARYLARHGKHFEPPYDDDDVTATLERLVPRPLYEPFEVLPGVTVTFLDSGHILGSAFVVIDAEHDGQTRRVVFTGDHGRRNMPILRDPDELPACDALITESTYGDRLHPVGADLEADLEQVVNQSVRDGGRLLIPAFSVGRTQNVLMFLGKLIKEGRIPRLPIFIDSPMSKAVTAVTGRHPEVFDAPMRAMLEDGHDPFHFAGVRFVADVEESKSLNDQRSGIIISASGMCESGRILHHIKQSIGRPEDCILIVGFMAEGTLGRKLVEHAQRVRILGREYEVRCKVRSIGGLSAHADYQEMLDSYRRLAPGTRVFVVHGEERVALEFAERLRAVGFTDVEVPVRNQKFEL